jgi:hypothetical protein
MPILIQVHKSERLAVACCSGIVHEREVHEAIEFSFEVERVPGGVDRIVLTEPTADLGALDAEALHRIQSHVFRKGGAEATAPFRSILVTPSPFHRPLAELYKAIWDSYRLPGVEFLVVTTLDEGARLLGLPPSSALLLCLRPADRGAARQPATPGHSGHC